MLNLFMILLVFRGKLKQEFHGGVHTCLYSMEEEHRLIPVKRLEVTLTCDTFLYSLFPSISFQDGLQLVSEKPETEAVVKEKLSALHKMWEELESTTQTKAQCLFDANKAELFTQSCADLDKWLGGLEGQIQSDDYGKDLTSVNILLKKQQVLFRWKVEEGAVEVQQITDVTTG